MINIGYYYGDNGISFLYKSPIKKTNWVTNICYFDQVRQKLYSPNLKNLAEFGRDSCGLRRSELYWLNFITDVHDSFVLR